jgi:hypothetical protein
VRFSGVIAAALCAASALPAQAATNLLTNGSFEAVQATGPSWFIRSFSSTPGWTQHDDGVDLIHNNYEQPTLPVLVDASDGVQFLDMNQANLIGGLSQVVNATSGRTYQLTLDATAWATNSRGGTVGYRLFDGVSGTTLSSGSFTDPTGGVWVNRTISAVATSNKIGVDIYSIVAAQAGMGVDNVVLTALGGGVPEPASWALMIGGFGLIGAASRRRRIAVA